MSKPIKVLIVDDHTLFRQGLIKLFEACEEVKVIGEAGNGKEALAKIDSAFPDLILMDIKMPHVDGLESVKLIKEKCPGLPVIILSMYEEAEYVIKAINLGANGYIQKNVSADRLIEVIKQVYEGNNPLVHLAINSKVLQEISEAKADEDKILSHQEKQVLRLIAEGNTNKQIAEKLFVSDQTVKAYIHNILRKLGASDRAQAVAIALKEDLL